MSAHVPQVVDPQEFTSLDEFQFTGNAVTVKNKRQLVIAYRQRGTIAHAAETVGVSRKCVHHYINTDPAFAQAIVDAHEHCTDTLESSVYERAFKSDLLAMFYLKAYRPRFRDKLQVDVEVIDNEIRERMAQLGSNTQILTESDSPQKED